MDRFYDFTLKEGSSMVVSGPTRCGKSTFVHALLNDKTMFDSLPDKIYWFYGQATDDLKAKDYIIKEGLPDSFSDIPSNSVIVLDDLMDEAKDHPGVTNLFTKLVHHRNLFVINITQNFFLRTNATRTRRLNSQYLVIFKNPSDATQIAVIGRQMYPKNSNFLSDVYTEVTKQPHGYVFIDLRQETDDALRIRTHMLKREFPMCIYKQEPRPHKRIINKDGSG